MPLPNHPAVRRQMSRWIGAAVLAFLVTSAAAQDTPPDRERRITPSEFDFSAGVAGGAGTSGAGGIRTVVLKGDPEGSGLYTIMLRVPAHTVIAAHTHPDDRVATVISGVWRIGYGDAFDRAKLKALPPGSFYTEPAGQSHFAETGDTPVIVQITGFGPTGTHYVDPALDPNNRPH